MKQGGETLDVLPPSHCRYCGRRIVDEGGTWIDPDAAGDDSIWREACDAHDSFTAEHAPKTSDAAALVAIHAAMDEADEWDADLWDVVADLVRSTGRAFTVSD